MFGKDKTTLYSASFGIPPRPNSLVITAGTDASLLHWSNGMKTVYLGNLAQNHTLHVNGNDYPCNEAVMHAALPNVPMHEWTECFSTISNFWEGTELIPQLLQYFYTCEISVCMDTLSPLLKASRILKLPHLQEACEDYLFQHLYAENFLYWLKFGVEEDFETIHQKCKDGIFKELDNVQFCQDFHKLNFAEITELFEEHVKLGQSADKLFSAALAWIKKNDGQDYEKLFDVFDLSKCSKQALKMATEDHYEKLIWSASFQNKLFRASLLAESRSNEDVASANRSQPCCDETNGGSSKHCLDLTYPSVKRFALEMIQAFQDFQKENKHTDITINLSDNDIEAHQVVLAAGSPYFEALLRNHASQEQNIETVEADLTTMDPAIVPVLVDYMYSRSIEVLDEVLLEHIYGCDFLQMDTFLTQCKKYAEEGVRIFAKNCIEWIIGHRTFNIPVTKKNAMEFICRNFKDVCESEGFLTLDDCELLETLNHSDWAWAWLIVFEKDLLKALIAWINHDHESRKECLVKLLDSSALSRCSVCLDLDMTSLLDAGSFDIRERDQIWQTHCTKMAKVRLFKIES